MTPATGSRPPGPHVISAAAEVSARWVKEIANDFGRLAITSDAGGGRVVTEYDVQIERDGRGRPLGYVLAGDDDALCRLPADLSTCDGSDCLGRDRECRHQKGLKAALARPQPLGVGELLEPPPPPRAPGSAARQ